VEAHPTSARVACRAADYGTCQPEKENHPRFGLLCIAGKQAEVAVPALNAALYRAGCLMGNRNGRDRRKENK